MSNETPVIVSAIYYLLYLQNKVENMIFGVGWCVRSTLHTNQPSYVVF